MANSSILIKLYQLFLISSFILVVISNKDYTGYKIYVFLPKDEGQSRIVEDIVDLPGVDAFKKYRQIYAPEYMLAPEIQPLVNDILKYTNVSYEILVKDIGRSFSRRQYQSWNPMKSVSNGYISFTDYESYEAVQSYLARLANEHPNLVDIANIGITAEGRNISVIRITNKTHHVEKPVILIDAGIHAREWIAPAFALYIIHRLVENSEHHLGLLNNFDWYIIPLLNPDGYDYSMNEDRLWRKNRSKNFGSSCVGADLNRNFEFHWSHTYNRCATDYAGDSGFSELETRALRDLGYKLNKRILVYLSLHAYGPLLLYPWGFTKELPVNYKELDALATAMVQPLNDQYVYGSSNRVLYAAPGGSDDWFMGVLGVKYSFTWELPPGGLTGFEVPTKRILPLVVDSFRGIEAMGKHLMLKTKHSRKRKHTSLLETLFGAALV